MDILQEIRRELKHHSDPHTRATGQGFFKEKVKLYGVKTALVTKIAKQHDNAVLSMPKNDAFSLCEAFWQSGYMEESFVACHFSYRLRKNFAKSDFRIFEKWVKNHVSNWASCDTFCSHTVASFIEMYPDYLGNLIKWTRSNNRWVKRAAAVTLIIPARRGKFLDEIFTIADNLLMDDDDLVQKGYGWMLKSASQAHQAHVFDYVMKNRDRLPRTALRYAIEKMPAELKLLAMAKQGN